MTKDRNCGNNYPLNYVPVMPMMPNQMMPNQIIPNQQVMPNYNQDCTDQINMINNKLMNLERRINNLESLNSNYNNTGYQMM